MPNHFRCVHCSFSLTDTNRPTTCPACGRAAHTPAAPTNDWWVQATPPAPPAPASVQTKPIALPPLPAPTPTARPVPVALAATFGGIFLCVVAAVAVLALPRRPAPQPPVAEVNEPVPELVDRPYTEPNPLVVGNETPTPQPGGSSEQPGEAAAPAPRPAPRLELPKPPPVKLVVDKSKPRPKGEPAKLAVKRRADVEEADLLKQLEKVPELRLDRSQQRVESNQMLAVGKKARQHGRAEDSGVALLEKRPDLAGMPWLKGDACKISPSAADNLQEGSLALRDFMSDVARAGRAGGGGNARPDPKNLHDQLNKNGRDHNRWLKAEAIPALQQLLMAEDESVREVLVDQLAKIDGKKASAALAQRALYDLHPRVRERALAALQARPAAEYRDTLLGGFHHPWPAVAEHAAEAVIALKMKETVPNLMTFLDLPAPNAPFKDEKKGVVVKELVRVNHLLNCLMCHAPSTKQDDKVRGRVPRTNQALPPAFSRQYYADGTGTFVRAEVTYLRQDFSVPLKVPNHGVWPEVQRFDFVVRERPALPADLAAAKLAVKGPTAHQKALFFALRELTGADPGPTVEDWKKHLVRRDLEVKAVVTGLKNARGLAAGDGKLYLSDGALLLRQGDARPATWIAEAAGIEGLALDGKGNVLAAQGKGGQVVRIDASSREQKVLASKFDGRRFVHPRRLAADRNGGVYFSDDVDPESTRDGGNVYYVSAQGSVTKLSVSLARPRGLALSNDGKTLYVASPSSAAVMAYAVESAGSLGKGVRLARVGSGVADLAVDGSGNLAALDAASRSVEVLAPSGVRLAVARLPDVPIACAVRERTLYVLTKKAVYSIDLADADVTRVAKR